MSLVGWFLVSTNVVMLVIHAIVIYRLNQAIRRHRAIADGYISLLASQGIAIWDEKE